MAFFNPKKENQNLKTLSEKDIQKKLYGRLHSKQAGHESSPAPPDSFRKQDENDFLPAPPDAPDLFESEDDDSSEAVKPDPRKERPVERKVPVNQWIRQENQAVSSYTREIQEKAKQKQEKRPVWSGIWRALVKFLTLTGQTLLAFVKVVAGGVIGLFFAIDFRKPLVRQIAYWLAAGCLISGLLFGVHFLNVQREKAMKGVKSAKPPAAASAEIVEGESPENVLGVTSETIKQPQKTSAPSSLAAVEPRPETLPQSQKRYVIQVATYAGPRDAERVVSKLRDQSIDSFAMALTRPSGKVYHSVFVGNFETFREAETALGEFKKTEAAIPFQDAFIRKI